MVGDEVRDVVALVGSAGDRRPRDAAPLGDRKREGEQRERRGLFIAVEMLPSGTPSSARSMWSVVLITVPQVPSRTGSTSSQSTPRKPELHGSRLIAVAPASRMTRTRSL
jgi:hypothetical protein